MADKLRHISHPLDDARRRTNDANHHIYRAGSLDTAYELSQALKKLNEAKAIIEQVQRDYAIARPERIDTSLPPDHPFLAPDADIPGAPDDA